MATQPPPSPKKTGKAMPVAAAPQPDPVNRPPATLERLGQLAAPLQQVFTTVNGPMPKAAIVYAAGSSMVFVAMLFALFAGNWITALILLVISGVLMAHSVVMLKNQGKQR